MLSIFYAVAALLNVQPASAPTPDPALVAEVAAAAEAFRPQLPMRQQAVTITSVAARGVELIFDLDPDVEVDAGFVSRFRAALPGIACGNPEARAFLTRGGTYTYRLRDEAGQVFSASISRC